jgi:PAS domain S-box-containing protein
MAAGEVLHSFALLDPEGRLIDWDEGFEREFYYAAGKLRRGMTYAELLTTALDGAGVSDFLQRQTGFNEIESLIRDRLKNFGKDQSREYHTPDGHTVVVEELRTVGGNIRRLARDVTGERRAEGALAMAQQRIEAADFDTGGVYAETVRKPDGSYVFPPVSEGLLRMLDLPLEWAGGDPMLIYSRMIRTADDDAEQAVLMERSAQTMEICPMEYRIRDGKDRIRWIRQSMMPRREPDGTVVFAGIMRDVTREKEVEDRVELLRSIVVRSSDSMVVFESEQLDPEHTKIAYVNPRFTELFGGSAEELTGKPILALAANSLNEEGEKLIWGSLARDDGEPVEFETRGKDGRLFWVEARVETVQKLPNGSVRWAVISRDVTERRRAQEEIVRAKEAAEAGNRAKSNFLANMSHELRTPLNAIIGFTELISQGVATEGWNPSYAEYLADVSSSGRHLLELINTILDLSKIEAGSLQLNLTPVDPHELLRGSISFVANMAQESGVKLSMKVPDNTPEIVGDFLKLKQVLINILSNAVKFTEAGGKVSAGVTVDAKQMTITVTDTGCGISQDDLERVMLPFVQAENSLSRRYSGSGLGLAIARELVTLHGGTIAIESEAGRGTTVRIALPRGRA